MPDSIEQILRVADWRVKGLKTRLAQCTLVAVLAYGGSKSELVAVWYAVTMLIGVADAWVFRHLRRHADHSLSRRLALVSASIARARLEQALAARLAAELAVVGDQGVTIGRRRDH